MHITSLCHCTLPAGHLTCTLTPLQFKFTIPASCLICDDISNDAQFDIPSPLFNWTSRFVKMTVPALLPNQSSLPNRNSTSSYWHQSPSDKLLKHRTTPDLPNSSPVIIIGSGITGAFAARELVQAGREVLMLEAREACWGATGRVSHCPCRPHTLPHSIGQLTH